jgi:hypothetical protein
LFNRFNVEYSSCGDKSSNKWCIWIHSVASASILNEVREELRNCNLNNISQSGQILTKTSFSSCENYWPRRSGKFTQFFQATHLLKYSAFTKKYAVLKVLLHLFTYLD